MYKDREKAKAASRERMRKMRQGVTETNVALPKPKGVTSNTAKGVTKTEGVTRVKAQGVTKGVTVPEFARVLPQSTINRIKSILYNRALKGLSDDSEGRWERAVEYYDWLRAGRPVYG